MQLAQGTVLPADPAAAAGDVAEPSPVCEVREAALQECLLGALASGAEGLMLKDLGAAYEPSRRSDHWIKIKKDYCAGLADSLDLVPIGAWHGNGRKAGCATGASLRCAALGCTGRPEHAAAARRCSPRARSRCAACMRRARPSSRAKPLTFPWAFQVVFSVSHGLLRSGDRGAAERVPRDERLQRFFLPGGHCQARPLALGKGGGRQVLAGIAVATC